MCATETITAMICGSFPATPMCVASCQEQHTNVSTSGPSNDPVIGIACRSEENLKAREYSDWLTLGAFSLAKQTDFVFVFSGETPKYQRAHAREQIYWASLQTAPDFTARCKPTLKYPDTGTLMRGAYMPGASIL